MGEGCGNAGSIVSMLVASDVKLEFFQNRNSNPKNRLKLETCFLLYPSSMVKRVRINTFYFTAVVCTGLIASLVFV